MALQCVMEQLFFVLKLKGVSEMHGWDKESRTFFYCGLCLFQLSNCEIADMRDGCAECFLQYKRGVSACP